MTKQNAQAMKPLVSVIQVMQVCCLAADMPCKWHGLGTGQKSCSHGTYNMTLMDPPDKHVRTERANLQPCHLLQSSCSHLCPHSSLEYSKDSNTITSPSTMLHPCSLMETHCSTSVQKRDMHSSVLSIRT